MRSARRLIVAAVLATGTPVAAAAVEGPFGLRFGMAQSEVGHPKIADVPFNETGPGCVAELTRLHDPRELPTLVATGITVEVDPALATLTYALRVGWNDRIGLAAGYYRIPFGGTDRKVCLGFHRDRLYLVAIAADEIGDLLAGLPESFDRRLQPVPVHCRGNACWRAWLDGSGEVLVSIRGLMRTGYASGADRWALRQGSLTYTYIPVKVEQNAPYIAAFERLLERAPREPAAEGSVLERIQRGFGFDR